MTNIRYSLSSFNFTEMELSKKEKARIRYERAQERKYVLRTIRSYHSYNGYISKKRLKLINKYITESYSFKFNHYSLAT